MSAVLNRFPKRFYVGNCMGTLIIVDTRGTRPDTFVGNGMVEPHRAAYTPSDAQAIVDMLNERESWAVQS